MAGRFPTMKDRRRGSGDLSEMVCTKASTEPPA
jgi:hypothetical protein